MPATLQPHRTGPPRRRRSRDRLCRHRSLPARAGRRAPLGHAAWGGAHAHFSTAQRIASAVAVLVWTGAALIVLGRAGLWSTGKRARLFMRGTWFLAGVSVIAALTNFASHSRYENLIFGPLAVILALLCTTLARSRPDGHPRRHANGAPTSNAALS